MKQNLDLKNKQTISNSNKVDDISRHLVSLFMTIGNRESKNNMFVENKNVIMNHSKLIFVSSSEDNKENSDFTGKNEPLKESTSRINLNYNESINNHVYYINGERYINGNYYDKYGRYCGSFENEKFYSCYYYYYNYHKDYIKQNIFKNINSIKNYDNYVNNYHSKSHTSCSYSVNEDKDNKICENKNNKYVYFISESKTSKLIDLTSILNNLEFDLVKILSSNYQNKDKVNIVLEKIINENYIDFSQIKFSQYLNVYDLLDSTISNKRRRVHLNSINFLNKKSPFNYKNEKNHFNVDISSGILLLINTKYNSIIEFDLNINVFLNRKNLTSIRKKN
ncbi:hypothetical protein FG379_001660 [Cryptosporidium bovis]|uniref:uncharacterized protein n=1 Tax=Cryptosporidium bovis TaxID=310047 RepID=UPI00351A3AA1|nr:hypothetical protein FG379_001660 [Cryptosporidium bovis]